MANWWEFTADRDRAIRENHGLHKPTRVAFAPGATALSNGVCRATLFGDAGFGYAVQATIDYATSTLVATNPVFQGTWQTEAASTSPQGFYRARPLP